MELNFKKISAYTLLLPILGFYLVGCTTNNRAPQTVQNNPSPTNTPTPDSSPFMQESEDRVELPNEWTSVYDGALFIKLAYPNEWYLRPATNRQGELAVYSFDPSQTPNQGSVPASEIKVGIVYFGPNDPRESTPNENSIISETQRSIDGYRARVMDSRGQRGSAKIVEIMINKDETYLISAYPLESELMPTFLEMLDYIDLDARAPVSINSFEVSSTIQSPAQINGTIIGSWLFEGQTKIELRGFNSDLIAESTISTNQDWMTNEKINFQGKVNFDDPDENGGYLYIQKSNPSGLVNKQETFSVPVRFN